MYIIHKWDKIISSSKPPKDYKVLIGIVLALYSTLSNQHLLKKHLPNTNALQIFFGQYFHISF